MKKTYDLLRGYFVICVSSFAVVGLVLPVVVASLSEIYDKSRIITNLSFLVATIFVLVEAIIMMLLKKADINFLYCAFANIFAVLLSIVVFFNSKFDNSFFLYFSPNEPIYKAVKTLINYLQNLFLIKAIIGLSGALPTKKYLATYWKKLLIIISAVAIIELIGNLTGGFNNPTMSEVAELASLVTVILEIVIFILLFKTLRALGKFLNTQD